MNEYQTLSTQETDRIKLDIYIKFEKKFKKENKNFNAKEFEYKRNLYISQNFYKEVKKYIKSRK